MRTVTVALLFAFSLAAHAQKTPVPAPPTAEAVAAAPYHVPDIMRSFLNRLVHLQPLLVSPERFADKSSRAQLEEDLAALTKSAGRLSSETALQKTNYFITGRALQHQLAEGSRLLTAGKADEARRALLAVPSLCIQCHMQGGGYLREIFAVREGDLKGSAFERGEFLFATRNFQPALAAYQRALAKPSKGAKTALEERRRIFDRKLAYFVRTKRDFAGALAEFKRDSASASLTKVEKARLREWSTVIEALAASEEAPPSGAQLIIAVSDFFGRSDPLADRDVPKAFYLAGLVSDAVIHEGLGELAGDFLYWAGRSERALAGFSQTAIPNLFFAACAERFATQEAGKRCKAELN